jgi:hypothetical protein
MNFTNKDINKPRYEVMIYDGQTITTKTMTREQVMELNPQAVDYFLSMAFGILGFRTNEDEWIQFNNADWSGLGDVCIKIIQAILLNPGEFLKPQEIADLTDCFTLRNPNALSARLMAIRKVHKESYRKPRFFLSRKTGGFAIAFNPQCSWMWIERIPPVNKTS